MPDLIQIEDPNDPGAQRPAIRPLEVSAVEEDGKELLVLADPLHLLEEAVVLPAEYLPFLELLDGNRSLNQLCEQLVRETGELEVSTFLRNLVSKLDEFLLLDSPRFREAWKAHVAAYREVPTRVAALAGISYPEEPAELTGLFERLRVQANDLAKLEGVPVSEDAPEGLVAPHIDLGRGGSTMARAFLEWEGLAPRIALAGGSERPAEIVVAFGTGHSVIGSLAVPTRKDFETPLGTVPVCRGVLDAVASKLGGERVFAEEIAHRDEHSLEFQAIFLADLMKRGARFELVPFLCGSFHPYLESGEHPKDDPGLAEFIAVLRDALRADGRPVRFLAGVDFSHVGARFGDEWELSEENLAELAGSDRRVIEAALTGSADEWFETIATMRDATHICGFSSTYLMLRAMKPQPGRLLHYEQSPEEDSQSVVTYAALDYPAGDWRDAVRG